jgi:hypothetical protein
MHDLKGFQLMSDATENLQQELENLFRETGKDHHEAFIDTDGEDLEWPSWYAEKMLGRLSILLDAKLTKSELVYLLIWAEKERSSRSPGADWSRSYAKFFIERYA